ncbi:MAG: YHS domain-containing protein [Acidobacteriota bacterium]|nr:YHS domain-containing protein [Acidobacteriota bacterium]
MLGRIIILGLLFYLVYRVVKFFQRLGEAGSEKYHQPPAADGKMMVKDEMCNTYVPEDEALREVREGKTYYFCSETCRQKFIQVIKNKH